jgi:hypothetical protein
MQIMQKEGDWLEKLEAIISMEREVEAAVKYPTLLYHS